MPLFYIVNCWTKKKKLILELVCFVQKWWSVLWFLDGDCSASTDREPSKRERIFNSNIVLKWNLHTRYFQRTGYICPISYLCVCVCVCATIWRPLSVNTNRAYSLFLPVCETRKHWNIGIRCVRVCVCVPCMHLLYLASDVKPRVWWAAFWI